MDAKNTLPETPEFKSLTEIMDRFNAVPYDQFQQELNDWFYRTLDMQQGGSGLQDLKTSGIGNLPALVSEIYHRAELLSALSDAKIITGNGDK